MDIGHNDLKEVIDRKEGFLGLNAGIPGCTAPWSRLQLIGLVINGDGGNFSGPVEILVNRGGILNRNISGIYSEMFKKEVFPSIKNFAPEYGETFKLILHYSERLLIRTVLCKR